MASSVCWGQTKRQSGHSLHWEIWPSALLCSAAYEQGGKSTEKMQTQKKCAEGQKSKTSHPSNFRRILFSPASAGTFYHSAHSLDKEYDEEFVNEDGEESGDKEFDEESSTYTAESTNQDGSTIDCYIEDLKGDTALAIQNIPGDIDLLQQGLSELEPQSSQMAAKAILSHLLQARGIGVVESSSGIKLMDSLQHS